MLSKSWNFIFLMGIFLPNSINGISDLDMEAVDGVITDFMAEYRVPGVSFGLVNGVDFLAKGYGERDVAGGLPVENNTLFLVGSISKSMTSLLVAKVLNDLYPGNVEAALDAPISALLSPGQVMFGDRFRTQTINFRDLVSHRSCIDSNDIGQLVYGVFENRTDFNYRGRYREEICQFRNEYIYNNAAYDLAAHYISILAGKSVEQIFAEFFATLGMSQSRIVLDDDDFDTIPNMSRSYVINPDQELIPHNQQLLTRLSYLTGAGGVMSTSADMLKYMHVQMTLGKNLDGVQVIPEAVVRAVQNIAFPLSYRIGPEVVQGYSLGLSVSTYIVFKKFSHGGYFAPYASLMSLFPELNFGIFTSFNGPGSGPPTDLLHVLIIDAINTKIGKNSSEHKIFYKNSKTALDLSPNFPTSDATKFPISKLNQKMKFKAPELEGLFGHRLFGNAYVEYREGDPKGDLYFRYGWGTGYMEEHPQVGYTVNFETDAIQDNWANQNWVRELTAWLDFPDLDTLHFGDPFNPVIFKRNATLDTFPEKIWEDDSCLP